MRYVPLIALMALAACSSHDSDALAEAVRAGRTAEMKDLIARGENPNRASGVNDWPLIMHAVHKNQMQSVATLLDLGAGVNGADTNGETALMMAAGYGDDEMVRLLLRRGADPELADRRGRRAVDYARTGVADIDNFTLFSNQESTVKILAGHRAGATR